MQPGLLSALVEGRGETRQPLGSFEAGDDLPGEALDHFGLVGDARQVDDEVVDPGLGPRPQALDYHFRRANHVLLRVLVVAAAAARQGRCFYRVFALFEEVDVYGARTCDLLVVAPQALAVPAQHAELVAQSIRVAEDVAGVAPTGDKPEGDLLAAAPDPERRGGGRDGPWCVCGLVYFFEIAI